MRFVDFILALDKAGWQGVTDAQHAKIYAMWESMFPVVAELEKEIEQEAYDVAWTAIGADL